MGASTPPFGDLSGAGDESAASAAAFRRAKSMSAARVWVGLLRGLGLRKGDERRSGFFPALERIGGWAFHMAGWPTIISLQESRFSSRFIKLGQVIENGINMLHGIFLKSYYRLPPHIHHTCIHTRLTIDGY